MALQDAAAAGEGAVVTYEHTTVDNEWWGINAGMKVKVTWVYLSRVLNWEKELPAEVQKHLNKNQEDPSLKAPLFSKFSSFPYVS